MALSAARSHTRQRTAAVQAPLQPRVQRARLTAAHAKLLSRSDIPAFIPRRDMMQQLDRWAHLDIGQDGVTNFGIACELEHTRDEDDTLWNITVHMQREGKRVASIQLGLDQESAIKYEFIGRKEDGMPEPMGEQTPVKGAHFEMWKLDDDPVDASLADSIKELCSSVGNALTRFYAFGSIFSEDL